MSSIATMKAFITLYQAALTLEKRWSEREAVDWSEAEEFVDLIKAIEPKERKWRSSLQEILDHVEQNDDWESSIVGSWPSSVIEDLESMDKVYDYRSDGDNWEVFSLEVTGEEEWKATVETERIAEILTSGLNQTDEDAL